MISTSRTLRRSLLPSGSFGIPDRPSAGLLVDTIKGSRHANMKELRPGSTGRTEIRVLFAFDLERQAILLVGGDKSDDWTGWYKVNIPIADDRFAEHQEKITQQRRKATKDVSKKSRTKKGRGLK
jgi:hypothetical protein